MKNIRTKTYFALLLGLAAATSAVAADEKPADNAAAPAAVSAPAVASRALWSWQAVQPPVLPAVADKGWVKTPIDAYILAKLEENKLKPSEDASRATFIRRATLDAWGVIPTPEAVAEFVNDSSDNAYEKLVDRLLASPHYGERQARLWLDLARYADSAGFQQDITRPNNWRYRDYVINAFNQDKPYDQFIKEQLAGDEIAPGNQDVEVATGFLAGYPDNRNSRDFVQRKYQITTDMTDTVGAALIGTTIGCARCHNHKSDKLTQKDYYSFQAFFANTSFVEDKKSKKGDVEAKWEEQNAKWDAATKDIRAQRKAIIDTIRAQGVKYHKERYLTDTRESLFKPQEQWNALDRWVNHHYDTVTTDADLAAYLKAANDDPSNPAHTKENTAKWEAYEKLTKELRKFDYLRPNSGSVNYTSATELGHGDSPKSYVFFVGNHEHPLDEVQPAFPEGITSAKPDVNQTETTSGRRTALANWIASADNPLTARVLVNRLWEKHFGKGIVATTSDFGKAGDKPTNQELLDYLAYSFVKDGWSIKKLERQILLSHVYRQSSDYQEAVNAVDPENKLLASFPLKRLEAEEIRDSLLLASGKLNEAVGGPSVFPPIPASLVPVDNGNILQVYNATWNVSKDPQDQNRRSIYIFTKRSLAYPLLEPFDMANPQQVHSKRDVTTTPLQALTLLNNDLVFQWSQALAGRVIREAGKDEDDQLERLYQILFSRSATRAEKRVLTAFLDEHEKVIADKALDGNFTVATPISAKSTDLINPIRAAAFVDLVHTVANSNSFIYRY